jgi:uncharacterized protein (TIGR02996 family)
VNDYESFLQAVLNNPLDDLPRLVMADWLDENADRDPTFATRAALIRHGVAGNRGAVFDVEVAILTWRRFFPHVDDAAVDRLTTRRGFVESFTTAIDRWQLHGPAAVRESPIQRLAFVRSRPMCDGGYHIWAFNGVSPFTVPAEWVDHFPDGAATWRTEGVITSRGYSTEAAARVALSLGAIAWAKAQAR